MESDGNGSDRDKTTIIFETNFAGNCNRESLLATINVDALYFCTIYSLNITVFVIII